MRHILVDHKRRRAQEIRQKDAPHVSLDEALEIAPERTTDLVTLDDALLSLAALDPRKGRIVELRFFGGLSGGRDSAGTEDCRQNRPALVEQSESLAVL